MFTHCVVSLLSAEADTAEVGAKLTAGFAVTVQDGYKSASD
jgi:hypothetical protein